VKNHLCSNISIPVKHTGIVTSSSPTSTTSLASAAVAVEPPFRLSYLCSSTQWHRKGLQNENTVNISMSVLDHWG